MIRILTTLFVFCFCFSLSAQQLTRLEVVQSGNYYYGSGISDDENRAREEAIAEICEMIAVNVSSRFELDVSETNSSYNEKATSLIKTYSTGSLRNVESIRNIQEDGRIEMFSFILRSEVYNIFHERIQFVRLLKQNADLNKMSGNMAMALKNYYFGLILLKSVPAERIDVKNNDLLIEIPQAIRDILDNVNFVVESDRQISDKERLIEFKVDYKGQPVSLLHFRFWDGSQLSGEGQVRDGMANISLLGPSINFDDLKVYIKYLYYNARLEYSAVEDLWELVSRPSFQGQKTIKLDLELNTEESKSEISECFEFISKSDIPVEELIFSNTNSFIESLKKKNTLEASQFYNNDQFLRTKFLAYLDFNEPWPICTATDLNINKTRLGYEVRKIPVIHKYPSLHKQSNEYLVLDFNEEGNLIDFNLCITDDLYEKFVMQSEYGKDWGNRQEIIKFIEKYRTAYFTRDIQTIDLMFADEALILIGRKIQARQENGNEIMYAALPGQPGFEQVQLSKQEYLTRQKKVFDFQEDIFIDFSTFEIMKKNNAPSIYGVEMRQNYSSTTYADEGYLFLLIDFREQDPMIYIRAWQPNEWDTNTLINTSNFRIYK